jgi:ligand-binding sensor domain-containing protein
MIMKLSIPLYYFSFIFFLLYSNVCAQNSVSNSNADSKFYFERFSTEDGLPSRYVVSITQDKEGFIWLGTFDGLVKYDGYEFQIFRNIPGDSTSLSDNSIEVLYVDFIGDLWVGTKSGLNRYELSSNRFFRYFPDPSDPNGLTPGQINTFTEDLSQNLWIGTQQGGLFRYERESDSFTRFLYDSEDPNSLIEDQVRVLLADRNNFLWIGTGEPFDPAITGGGLVRFDLKEGTTKRFRHDPENRNSLIDDRVSALLEDKDGVLWIGTGQSGLHFYDPEEGEFVRMMPDPNNPDRLHAPKGDMGLWSSNPHVRILHQDKGGAFWVGTFNGGINHFNPVTNKLTHYIHEPYNPNSLVNNMIFTLFEDHQDRLWIGSIQGGLQKIEQSLHKFIVHINNPNNSFGLSSNNIKEIYEAPNEPGIVWLSTSGGGLNKLDLRTGHVTVFRESSKDENSISSDIVWTTFEDRTGAFWVGTEKGLDRLDRKTGKFSQFKLNVSNKESSITNAVVCMYEDQENFLWIGTWSGGIYRFDRDKKIIKQYNFSVGSHQTNFNTVYLIHEDAKGTLWVGTWLGALYNYDRQKDTFNPKLEGFGALCIQEDNSGWFWIGTEKDGLLHYDPTSDSVKIL